MYDILIVDDDRIILQGLYRMMEGFANGRRVHMASNGNEALELVCVKPIQLIFTDIKMPVCGGLELLEKLRKIDYRGETVIISGFDDYDFVREAMKLGASDYLLKPVVTGSLRATLAECDKRLRLRLAQQLLLDQQQGAGSGLRNLYTQQAQLEEIMNNHDSAVAFAAELPFPQPIGAVIFVADILGRDESSDLDKQAASLLFTSVAQKVWHDNSYRLLQGGYSKHWVVCVVSQQLQLEQLLGELSKAMLATGVKLGSDSVVHPITELRLGYSNALICLDDLFFDLPTSLDQGKVNLPHALDQLVQSIADCDMVKTADSINVFFDALGSVNRIPITELRQQLGGILYELMERNNRYISVVGRHKFTDNDLMAAIQEAPTLSYLKKQLTRIVGVYIGELAEQSLSTEDYMIHRVKRIVAENYAGNLSVKDISEQMSLHPNYFSSLFSQKMGQTFSDYLRSVRIAAAVKLMEESDLKVYEIGPIVGYQDNAHFYRAFKQVTGVPPGRYRCKKGEV